MKNESSLIDIQSLPEGIREKVESDIAKYGQNSVFWMLQMAPIQKMVKIETEQGKSNPKIWFQMVQHILDAIATKDPYPNHYASARESIAETEGGELLEADQDAVNMLAIDLLKNCRKVRELILGNKPPIQIQKDILIDISTSQEEESSTRPKDGMLWADKILLEFVANLGLAGKKLATELEGLCRTRYNDSWTGSDKNLADLWKVWVSNTDTFIPRFLRILSIVTWKDFTKPRWERKRNNTPAIAKPVFHSITPVFSNSVEVIQSEECILGLHEGDTIFSSSIPMVEKSLMATIAKGANLLNTLLAQKLIRLQCTRAFAKWVNRNEDFRLDVFEGGAEEIAELLGVANSRKSITNINALLEAEANLRLHTKSFKDSSILIMRRVHSQRTGKETSIRLIYGEQIAPEYVHSLARKDKILLPMPERLPPFVSAVRYHSAQALLQSLIISEFSERSVQLAEQGAVHLPDDKWLDLSEKAGLPRSLISKVKEAWVVDGNESPAFLDAVEPEFYTLSSAYSEELTFLQEQGQRRLANKKRAKGGRKKSKSRKRDKK